jgi:hypothetical protein
MQTDQIVVREVQRDGRLTEVVRVAVVVVGTGVATKSTFVLRRHADKVLAGIQD